LSTQPPIRPEPSCRCRQPNGPAPVAALAGRTRCGHRGSRVLAATRHRGKADRCLLGRLSPARPCRTRAQAAITASAGAPPASRLLDGDRAAGPAVLFEVALVVLLSPVKRGRRGDLRDDLPLGRLLRGIA